MPHELPPVGAFRSVTMCDAEGFQASNPLNRFAIGTAIRSCSTPTVRSICCCSTTTRRLTGKRTGCLPPVARSASPSGCTHPARRRWTDAGVPTHQARQLSRRYTTRPPGDSVTEPRLVRSPRRSRDGPHCSNTAPFLRPMIARSGTWLRSPDERREQRSSTSAASGGATTCGEPVCPHRERVTEPDRRALLVPPYRSTRTAADQVEPVVSLSTRAQPRRVGCLWRSQRCPGDTEDGYYDLHATWNARRPVCRKDPAVAGFRPRDHAHERHLFAR